MTLWERSLGYVYAAALVWDGMRKSVRPIAADVLRTLANKVDTERFEGAGAAPGPSDATASVPAFAKEVCPACWGEGGHKVACYRCGVVG